MSNNSCSDEAQNESTSRDPEASTQSAVIDVESENNNRKEIMTPFQSEETSSIRSNSYSERLRNYFGLSPKQWDLLVSFLLFLPYPVFILFIVTRTLNSDGFIAITLIYSVIAMILNFYL